MTDLNPDPLRPDDEPERSPAVIVWLALLALAIIVAVFIAASRSAQTTPAGDVSQPRSAEQSEAPRSGLPVASAGVASGVAPALVGEVGASSSPAAHPINRTPPATPETDTALTGTATWCGPTATQCQGWGGHALLGAVPTFRWGDEPYRVLVRHGSRFVIVTVVSFCACPSDRIIDLSPYAFGRLAPLTRGVIAVEVARLR